MNTEPAPRRNSDPPESLDYVNRDGSWHLDKRLNVSHLVATATVIGGLFVWSGKIDTRIALVEQQISQQMTQQSAIDARQDAEARALAIATRGDMRDISNKLDRLIEGKRQ